MADTDRDLRPTVEDYHSDESDGGGGGEGVSLESFRRSPAANVAAKRSHASDMGKPGAEKMVNIDLQSDSGYSSHTAATMSSADSAPSARSPPTAPASAAPIPPPSPAASRQRRPTLVTDHRKHSSQSSPRKPLQRAPSTASKRPAGNRRSTVTEDVVNCTDPHCTECGPNALSIRTRRPPPPSSHDSALDVSPYPYDVRSQRSDPAPSTYTAPPSPTYSRQPAPYAQGPAVVQTGQTRRRTSSTTGPRRPMSYSGEPGQTYWVPGMPAPYPSPPQEHGPPPSMARFNIPHQQMQQHPQMPPFMMPPSGPYYPHGQPTQTSSQYDQRPPLSARTSYQTRGPMSGYGPVVTQSERSEHMPSARFANPQSARQERFPEQEDDSESSEDDSGSDEDDSPQQAQRKLMPPPGTTSKSLKDRRPSLRHAKTTQVVSEHRERRMSRSDTLPERPRERGPRDPRLSRVNTTTGHSRAASTNRPTLIQNASKSQSYDGQRSVKAKVVVENSKSSRRQSHQPYEQEYEVESRPRRRESKIYFDDVYEEEADQKRRNRNSRVFRDRDEQPKIDQKRRDRDSKMYYDDTDHDAIVVPGRSRRRTVTEASTNRRPEYVEKKERRTVMDDAEAYQQRARGMDVPLNDMVHKAALKKQTRTPSDGASNRSDDRKTRVSRAPTTVTNGGGGEIRLRVDASTPLSLAFNGDMDGRTLQIQPAEGGMADIVIGNARDNENIYRSERGSVLAGPRKSILAPSPRRDVEESSVRSSRSSNGRREVERERREREAERPRGVLRRRTEYY